MRGVPHARAFHSEGRSCAPGDASIGQRVAALKARLTNGTAPGPAAAHSRRLTYIDLQCIKLPRMDLGKDLVAASATPLVLAILAEGDSYGYAIIKRVAELSGGHLQWTDGMLYPVLHRLERQGLV